jgi:DNA-binding NarL/FixJ family response regulator
MSQTSPQKPRTDNSAADSRKLTQKQTGFVAGISDGKSMRQAAKEAGYAESTASHADRDIMSA